MIIFRCDGKCGRTSDSDLPADWRKVYSIGRKEYIGSSVFEAMRNEEYFCPECWARAHTDKRPQDKLATALPVPSKSYQERVSVWFVNCFGLGHAGFVKERAHRFLEEAMELVQACGASREDGHKLVDYVWGRPVGEKKQEVGGTMVTLAILCSIHGIDMLDAGEVELTRAWKDIEKIRAKQAAKRSDSALPGYADEPSVREGHIDGAARDEKGRFTADDVDAIKEILRPALKDDHSSAEFPKAQPHTIGELNKGKPDPKPKGDWRLVLAQEIRSACDQYSPAMTARVGLLQLATNLEMTANNPLTKFEQPLAKDLDTPSFRIPADATPAMVIGAALLAVVDQMRLSAHDNGNRDMQTLSTVMAGKVTDFIKKYLQ